MDPNFRNRLVDHGGVAVGGKFTQTDAGEEVIGEGICCGCCIDWLRRELLCAKGGEPGNRFDSGVAGGMNTHYATGKRLQEVWDGENRYMDLYQKRWNEKKEEKDDEYANSPRLARTQYDTRMNTL